MLYCELRNSDFALAQLADVSSPSLRPACCVLAAGWPGFVPGSLCSRQRLCLPWHCEAGAVNNLLPQSPLQGWGPGQCHSAPGELQGEDSRVWSTPKDTFQPSLDLALPWGAGTENTHSAGAQWTGREVSFIWLIFLQQCLGRNSQHLLEAAPLYFRTFLTRRRLTALPNPHFSVPNNWQVSGPHGFPFSWDSPYLG